MSLLRKIGPLIKDLTLGWQYTKAGKVLLDASGNRVYTDAGGVLLDSNGPAYKKVGNLYVDISGKILTGFQVRADGRIDLNGWEDTRAASLWVEDYNGVLREIPGGIPLIVDSATGRTPRWDGTDYWVTDTGGAPITPTGQWAFEYWPRSTNYFLNSFAPATQTITLPSTGSYTLSIRGSGSAAIAAGTAVGTGWGTATDGNPVTIDITTAGSVTCTVTGSPDAVQLEDQPFASPVIQTSGASATRDACVIRLPSSGVLNHAEGMLVIDVVRDIGSDQDWLLGYSPGFLGTNINGPGQCYQQGTVVDDFRIVMYDGVNGTSVGGVIWRKGDVIRYASHWNAVTGKMQSGFKDISGVWHWSSEAAYDGDFKDDGYWWLFRNQIQNCKTPMLAVYNKDKGTQWIEDNY